MRATVETRVEVEVELGAAVVVVIAAVVVAAAVLAAAVVVADMYFAQRARPAEVASVCGERVLDVCDLKGGILE